MNVPILETAILEMCRMRGMSSFCPSEVVRWMYPHAWQHFMPDVRDAMMALYRKNLISVTKAGIEVDKNFLPKGPVRIQPIKKTNQS